MKRAATGLALFDFDGTLTHNDTFIAFIRVVFGYRHSALWATQRLPPLLARQELWRKPVETAKIDWIRYAFAGRSAAWLNTHGTEFARSHLPQYMRQGAVKRLMWHKEQGHHIYVISASLRAWIEPWCQTVGVPLLCTELEEKAAALTGELAGAHCNGPEKARRIQAQCNVSDYRQVFAYGDSTGDREMLALATEPCVNPEHLL